MEIELRGNCIDKCKPGDTVTVRFHFVSICVCNFNWRFQVVGEVVTANSEMKSGRTGRRAQNSSVYMLYLLGNSIVPSSSRSSQSSQTSEFNEADSGSSQLTQRDVDDIKSIADSEGTFARLIASLCPAIFGHEVCVIFVILRYY